MILLGALILYVLILTMLEQLSSRHVVVAAAAATPPSRLELLKFESLSDSTSSLNSLSSTLRNTFYTSNGIVLSAKTNWIAPVGAYKDYCYLCNYFGHEFNIYPNIRPEFLERCYRCWSSNHESKECRGELRPIPFKENFLKLSEFLKNFGLFKE